MPNDLKLNYGTKTITNKFIKGKELIRQSVVLALQCWLGDWWLNPDYGIPYDIRLENTALLVADVQDMILSVDGVSSVKDLSVKYVYDDGTKKTGKNILINATIILNDDENIVFEEIIQTIGY